MMATRQLSLFKLVWLPVALMLLLLGVAPADEGPQFDQLTRIERSIAAGADFLVREQQPDGSWKSGTYGLLKDGTALTPLVLWSVPQSTASTEARRRGLAVLASWIDTSSDVVRIRRPLQSPVYVGGLSLVVLSESSVREPELMNAWRELLWRHQLNEQSRWTISDPEFGGWGYGHDVPLKPMANEPRSPLAEPNISATVYALAALNQLGDESLTTTIRADALKFIMQCQNWRQDAPEADQRYNDGGFHFMLADEVRNKAGIAGIDSQGQTRFRSYGSATADGLRALLICGLKANHPQVMAAQRWLVDHFGDGSHPGDYPADRAHLKPSLDYYYAASVAHAFRIVSPDSSKLERGQWAEILSNHIMQQQRPDGSWSNPAVDVREDDPLIATSFALRTLQICREALLKTSQPDVSSRNVRLR